MFALHIKVTHAMFYFSLINLYKHFTKVLIGTNFVAWLNAVSILL